MYEVFIHTYYGSTMIMKFTMVCQPVEPFQV
jgi:hypothetical protein